MTHHRITKVLYLFMVGFLATASLAVALYSKTLSVSAQTAMLIPSSVGGIIAPGACPPAGLGDCDTLTFTPDCGAVISIVGPYGGNWGVYQWDMPTFESGLGAPYDDWGASYLTNGYPFTHAGEYMLGYAIPSLDPLVCPLPMLISIGVSPFKASPGE